MEPRYLDEVGAVITACGVPVNGTACGQRLKMCAKPEGASSAYGLCPVHGANPIFPFLDTSKA